MNDVIIFISSFYEFRLTSIDTLFHNHHNVAIYGVEDLLRIKCVKLKQAEYTTLCINFWKRLTFFALFLKLLVRRNDTENMCHFPHIILLLMQTNVNLSCRIISSFLCRILIENMK